MAHIISLLALMIIAGFSLGFVFWSVMTPHINGIIARFIGSLVACFMMIRIISYAIATAPNGMFIGLLLATFALTAAILCFRCIQLVDEQTNIEVVPLTQLSKLSLPEQQRILVADWGSVETKSRSIK